MKILNLLVALVLFAGCATTNTSGKTEARVPSSQICRAECVVQDTGWVPNLFRLLGTRLGPVEASDFTSLVRQCSQLADTYMKQNTEALLNKGVPPLYEQNLEFYFIGQLYSSLEINKQENREFIHSRSKEANALNSCGGN